MANTTLKTRIILRNDVTSGWTAVQDTVTLLKGEVGVELLGNGKAKMKVGDGESKWSQLKYIGGDEAQVFQGEVGKTLAEVVPEGTELNPGDIAIVKTDIDGTHTEYTAYVYNGQAWAAMDGNYSADNVYFDQDLTYTVAIGTLSKPGSSATFSAKGKSVTQVFSALMAQEKNPTTIQPSLSCTLSNAGAYEVGTKVSPSYTTSFNAGSYTYGPATGVTVSSYSVTGGSERLTTSSGTFSEMTVGDNTSYSVSATANHTEGAVPVTNLGNEYSAGKISSGSKTATSSGKITGYRAWFVGGDTKSTLTSADIRALTNKGSVSSGTYTVKASDYPGRTRIVVAIPSGAGTVTQVLLPSASNADITGEFKKQSSTVNVEGSNGYTAKAYNVWVYQPASLGSDEVYAITIRK